MAAKHQDTEQVAHWEHLRGSTVLCADGHRLGLVKDTQGSYLEIDAPRQRDFWLAVEHITLTAPDAVTLCFDKGDLDGYKLDGPGLEPGEDAFREIFDDTIVSPDEILEQRVRMERELAEQRQRLPHTHPNGDSAPPDTAGGTVGEPVESELPRIERQLPEQPAPARDLAPGPRAASHTGAIVPPADRLPETLYEPVREDTFSWRASELERAGDAYSEGSWGHDTRTAVLALIGATGLLALFAYVRHRRSHRRRLILG